MNKIVQISILAVFLVKKISMELNEVRQRKRPLPHCLTALNLMLLIWELFAGISFSLPLLVLFVLFLLFVQLFHKLVRVFQGSFLLKNLVHGLIFPLELIKHALDSK